MDLYEWTEERAATLRARIAAHAVNHYGLPAGCPAPVFHPGEHRYIGVFRFETREHEVRVDLEWPEDNANEIVIDLRAAGAVLGDGELYSYNMHALARRGNAFALVEHLRPILAFVSRLAELL